jgi:hypothetical protein
MCSSNRELIGGIRLGRQRSSAEIVDQNAVQTTMRLKSGLLALMLLVSSSAFTLAAEVLFRNNVVTCIATAPTVTRMVIEDVRFGVATDHAWGRAKIRVLLLDQTERVYMVRGYANLLKKAVTANRVVPTYSYMGVQCSAQHPRLTAVQNCRGSETAKSCDVGVRFSGAERVYGVSLTIEPAVLHRTTYER